MFHFPELPAILCFERAAFDRAADAEACFPAVLAELNSLLRERGDGFEAYVQTLADEAAGQFDGLDRNPDWSAYFLWKHGQSCRAGLGPAATPHHGFRGRTRPADSLPQWVTGDAPPV